MIIPYRILHASLQSLTASQDQALGPYDILRVSVFLLALKEVLEVSLNWQVNATLADVPWLTWPLWNLVVCFDT